MITTELLLAPFFLPLLGSALAYSAKAFAKGLPARILEYLGVFVGLVLPWGTLILTAGPLLQGALWEGFFGGWNSTMGIAWKFDGLTWLVNALGFSVAGFSWIYSLGREPKGPAFSAVFLIQTSALAATAMAADLFNLFVCLEVMGIASYVLITSSGKKGAYLASFSYLMVSAAAMIFFLLGLYGFYRLTGSLSYVGIAQGLALLEQGGGVTAVVSLALIVAAVAMRAAVMPLYGWLPDAHAMAPHAVSAVLSGVLIKTPLFALGRLLELMPAGSNAGEIMGAVGAFAAVLAALVSLAQRDAKRLLAYSSISHIGFIVAAWGGAYHLGLTTAAGQFLLAAAFLHALFHAFFKGLLFLTVGTATDALGNRDVETARGFKGLLTLVAFLVGALSLVGLPPFNGFVSKMVLSKALEGSWKDVLLLLAGIASFASTLRLSQIFWPRKRGTVPLEIVEVEKPVQVEFFALLSQLSLALICVLTGIFSPWILSGVMGLLSVGSQSTQNLSQELYSYESLLKTLAITAGGVVLYFLSKLPWIKTVLAALRKRPRSFHGLFLAFSLGVGVLSLWLVYR